MRRRALLVSLATSLAGCQGLSGDAPPRDTYDVPPGSDTPDGTTDRSTPTPSPRALPPARGTLLTVTTDPPRQLALSPTLSGVSNGVRLSAGFVSGATRESPARVWIGVGNRTDEPREISFGPTPPFSSYRGRVWRGHNVAFDASSDGNGDGVGALLVPVDDPGFPYPDVVPDGPGENGWTATDELGSPVDPVGPTNVTLRPGEGFAGEYHLLAAPGGFPDSAAFEFTTDWEPVSLGIGLWGPGADVVDSRFDRDVPELPGHAVTDWYHRSGTWQGSDDSPRAILRPESERLELPTAGTTFTLQNRSPGMVNGGGWDLYKLRDGWRHVAPWRPPSTGIVYSPIPAGGSQRLAFSVDNDPSTDESPIDTDAATFAGLSGVGPGLYAVRHGLGRGSPPSNEPLTIPQPRRVSSGTSTATPERPSDPIAYAALFELVGDRPPLTMPDGGPVGEIETERNGDTVTVRISDRMEIGEERGVLEVRRADDGPADATLIFEQVTQTAALRAAVVQLRREGVERVRVTGDDDVVSEPILRFGGDSESARLAFEGTTYRLTFETPED